MLFANVKKENSTLNKEEGLTPLFKHERILQTERRHLLFVDFQ